MTSIRIKKGYRLNMIGKPSLSLDVMVNPEQVAVLPERMPFIKPRLMVQEGDFVKIGTPLFSDKYIPDLRFLSPGCGTVSKILFGPRRVIKEIVIRIVDTELYDNFEVLTDSALPEIKRETLTQMIAKGGLWPLIRELPFRNIAPLSKIPPAIIVHLGTPSSFEPYPSIYLDGMAPLLEFGIHVLQRLSDTVHVVVNPDESLETSAVKKIGTHSVTGDYPAGDPGVFLYHIKKCTDENRAWYVDGQDVLLLASLLKTGRYPFERVITLSGDGVKKPRHIKTRMGAPLAYLAQLNGQSQDVRFILGGVFCGYAGSRDTYLGFYDKSLTLIPEGKERELLAFIRPGLHKPSYSKTFLSRFNKSELGVNCNIHGGARACIACGYCTQVCPVAILPQLMFKSIKADEVEEFLAHGLLDCVECGLCSYVCPSKIELLNCFKQAKTTYYKEQL